MKHSRYFTRKTANILGLALALILFSGFALLTQLQPPVLATKVAPAKGLSTRQVGTSKPEATPTLTDQSPKSPVQDPPLPITIPTPPIDLPIPIPTLPSLPVTIPTLPVPIPTLSIHLPGL